nr:JmjC domain-containing protein [Tanacetum cinerariifolium]
MNQVTPTTSNLEALKKIFKYLKGQPNLMVQDGGLVLFKCFTWTSVHTGSASIPSGTARVPTSISTLHFDHQPVKNLNPNSTSSMAALRYKDEHNKVSYLLKPTGSDDYHQIIDFLRVLTQGPPAIQATIDKTSYTITEDLILQAILGIETRIKRQYKVLMFSSKLFANMRLNFKGRPMPLLPAMLLQAQACEDTEVAAQAVPQHMPAPDQPQDHFSTPLRQQTSDPHAPVLEHGQSSDPNTASFSRSHETAAGPFTNVEDEPLGGSFHMSPPGSTQAPLHVNSLETELKDHKKLFKDVVGKLVKKVKAIEVKLKTKKRKMVVSDSDQEEGGKQDVDLDALRALANAPVTIDSNISPGGASNNPTASTSVPTAVPTGTTVVPVGASTIHPGAFTIPPGTSTVLAGSLSVPADVSPSVAPAGVSNKGKSLMVEEDIPVKARTFKQMEEDRLSKEATKRLHDEEQAQMDRQRAELQRRRQQEVLDSAMYYNEVDWINIRAQVEANASLSKTLLGDDVSEDNFSARMAALIKRKIQTLTEKLAQEKQNRPMTQAQQRTYMRLVVLIVMALNIHAL